MLLTTAPIVNEINIKFDLKKGLSMVKERKDVALNDRWNLEDLYPSFEAWENDFKRWEGKEGSVRFPSLVAYKGTLSKGADQLAEFIVKYLEIDRQLSKLYTYAHMRHDEDVGNDLNKQAQSRCQALLSDFRQELSWVEPEVLQMDPAILKEPVLKDYHIFLERMQRYKPHVLSAENEELMANAGMALSTAQKAFGAFNNGDLKFPKVRDSEGKEHELTHGTYHLLMKSRDRKLREEAYKAMSQGFAAYENTLCELINGQMQTHFFEMKARKFNSCLEAALFPHQIEPSVYHSLIKTVRAHLPSLHRYLALRKKLLGYDDLKLWDMSVPLVGEMDITMEFDDASEKIIESVSVLGTKYQNDLKKGLTKDRWVDRYENERKRSGGYSGGCYDSMPYILMNYHGTLSDVKTLTHEAGHSMHSFLSKSNQPYQYYHYPIFVAEVASTFHEELMSRYLMAHAKSKDEKCYLLNQRIDDIRSTFFRQAMFAEFELKLHEWVEKGVPLTPALLKTEYHKLNADYFGPDVALTEEVDMEWARIPHFYYDFYVYQYATGISAAQALVEKVTTEGDKARDKYLKFLSSGCSQYPLDLLADAGVDMRKPDAVEATVRYFDELVGQLEQLMASKSSEPNSAMTTGSNK